MPLRDWLRLLALVPQQHLREGTAQVEVGLEVARWTELAWNCFAAVSGEIAAQNSSARARRRVIGASVSYWVQLSTGQLLVGLESIRGEHHIHH